MKKPNAWQTYIVALIVVLLTACSPAEMGSDSGKKGETPGSNQKTDVNVSGFPIVQQPITLKAMAAKGPLHGEWKDMKVLNEYAKKSNITIDWTTIPENAYEEKRNISLAGGDLPDVFYRAKFTPFDEVNYGSQGVLIPLNKLIDNYAPNIKALFAKYPELKKSITAPDGNIYTLPQVADYLAPRIGNKPWINKKWLDQLQLSVPTTTDEFYNVLKAFKEKDPNGNGKQDEIPWSGDKTFGLWGSLRGAWGLGTAGEKNDNIDVDANGKIRFYTMDGKYKELLEYLAKLYKEGLIDKEVFTQENAQWYAKGSEGILGSTNASNTNYVMGPKYMNDYVSLPALKGPHGDQLYSPVNPLTQSQGTFAITKKNKYPEATIRWVDFFYSEEGSKFFRMGIEGETYETLPSGDVQYKDIIIKNAKGLSLDQAIGQYSPWPGGGLPQLITEKYDKTGNSLPSTLASAKLLQPYIPKEILPSFLFTKDEQDRLNALTSDVNTYVSEMRVKFITGAVSLSTWDNYAGTLKKMGVDELVKINQAAYDRYKKN